MAAPATFVYSADLLRSFQGCSSTPRRATRKLLFKFRLGHPSCQPIWTTQRLPATDSPPVMSSSTPSPSPPTPSPSPPTPSPSPPTPSPSQSVICIATLNVCSLRHKYVQVSDLITAAEVDVIVVTESWHSTLEDVAVWRAAPPGFSFIDQPRSEVGLHEIDVNGPHGGIVVYYRRHLTSKKIDIRIVLTPFEAVTISLLTRRGPVTLLAIYRPGSSSPSSTFFHELSAILEQFAMYNSQLFITRDLDLHVENPLLHETVEFAVVLDQFGLKQHFQNLRIGLSVVGGWMSWLPGMTVRLLIYMFNHLSSLTMASSLPPSHLYINPLSTSPDKFAIGRVLTVMLSQMLFVTIRSSVTLRPLLR